MSPRIALAIALVAVTPRERDGCAVYLGETEGGPVALPGPTRRALPDLSATWCGAGCRSWSERRYRFDGQRYRPAGSRECTEGPDGEPRCVPDRRR